MTRHGAVLVFRKGVTPEQAAAALERIRDVIEVPPAVRDWTRESAPSRPFRMADKVHEFDDEWGGPVWYVP